MPPEIIALIDKPYLLVAVLAVGSFFGVTLDWLGTRIHRQIRSERQLRRWLDKSRRDKIANGPWFAKREPFEPRRPDAADQLRIVMGADFMMQPLLNKSEVQLFKELDQFVIGCNPDWQVMAQVALGGILHSEDRKAYSCINSKRVDLLLVDEDCRPRHAIEYQGGAHYRGTAAARDAVNKEALPRAGIGYHEVVAGETTPSDLRRLVERLVVKPAAAQ